MACRTSVNLQRLNNNNNNNKNDNNNFAINISDKKSRRFDLSEVIFKCIKVLQISIDKLKASYNR